MSAGAVAVCTDLRRRFGERVAVDGVSFSIAAGETYGLLGPNGAGKTTTISMLCGVLAADAGHVEVAGRPVSPHHPEGRGAIGYVPQDLALYPDLSARENLRFFGRLQGLAGRRLDERTTFVLDVVGLADRADDRVDSYSGGMKRRANIAVGLLHEPQLLVLDEPTVGVDPQSRSAILDAVDALGGEGLAVLYTTHYMEEAERLCDRIGIIDEGRLVAEGTRRELGVTRRILAGPASPGTVVAGYAASRFAVALFQGTLVVVAGALLFGVRWGDPLAAAALVVAFSVVAAALGVLLGAVARTPEQAQSIAIPVGIAMGMLGGALWPLELVPDWLRQVGHLTPHAWAMDGWVTVIFRDGGVADIAVELGVLVAFGVVAAALGAAALRRTIASGR